MSVISVFRGVLDAKVYEPQPRKCGGSGCAVYVSHRFPIKGGISSKEVLLRGVYRQFPGELMSRYNALSRPTRWSTDDKPDASKAS